MATVKGKWVFNETLTFTDRIQQSVNFVSNGNNGTLITQTNVSGGGMSYKFSAMMPVSVYEYVNWVDEAYRTVDFGSTEQEVSDTFYTWFTANATQVIETPKTVITYNGSTIASLEPGQTATIKTASTEVDYDIVVKAGSGGGGGGGGSAEFNIAYGDTAPSDTSKLWVKANEPEAVKVTTNAVVFNEELHTGVGALPTAANGIAAAAVGTKVYLFGGDNFKSYAEINVFDTESNTITTLSAKLPKAAYSIAAAAVGTKVYLFGGNGGGALSTINVFDTESNTITTLSTKLPTATSHMGVAAVGTNIYLFGGNGGGALSTINVFDTESNTITTLSTKLPTAGYGIAAAAVGTKIYLFGGTDGNNLSTINVFDTKSNTISTLSTALPTAAAYIAAAAVGTKIYLFGGYGGGRLPEINVFDTESNTITTSSATLPTAAYSIAAAAVGTKVYLFGGFNNPMLSTINVLVSLMAIKPNNMIIEAIAINNLFNLLPNVEIGVNNVYIGNAEGYAEAVSAYLHNGTEWVAV